jgi:hypothetical protein
MIKAKVEIPNQFALSNASSRSTQVELNVGDSTEISGLKPIDTYSYSIKGLTVYYTVELMSSQQGG